MIKKQLSVYDMLFYHRPKSHYWLEKLDLCFIKLINKIINLIYKITTPA